MIVCLCFDSNTSLLCFIFSIVIITTSGFHDNLLKNDGQIDTSLDKKVFKLKKYNDIWFRANARNFSIEKLQRLKKIFYKLDRMELDVKHWDMEEQNNYVQMKPKVQEYLNEVLKEYDLLEHDILDYEDMHFQDDRLNQLWQHVVDEGHYTKDELRSLHNEMRHMEKKIEEVHAFDQETEDIQKTIRESENDISMSENMVEPMDALMLDLKKAEEMDKQLKKKKTTINKRFEQMREMVLNKKKTDFSDDRVRQLWNSAQNAKFTAAELETVKEELRHFQRHVDKLNHWENINSNVQRKGGGEEVLHAQDKINEYTRKVKKYHKTMVKKIKKKLEL